MSEQNKDRLSREAWLKNDQDNSSETNPDNDAGTTKADEWEKKALRGRALLTEAEAAALLEGLDAALDKTYGRQDNPEVVTGQKWGIRTWLSVAASAVFILLAAWWLWPGSSGPEQLYTQYFTHRDNDLSVNLMGPQDQDELTESLRPYNARRYAEAVQSLGYYLQVHPEQNPVRLYYGISLLETGETTEAITQLQRLRQAPVLDDYLQAADWYLSLAYLKSGQVQLAKDFLQTIANAQHPYQEKAKALLSNLTEIN